MNDIVRSLISNAIGQVISLDSAGITSSGTISGIFTLDKRLFNYEIRNDAVLYEPCNFRLDTKLKCKLGIPCGDVCIPKDSKCRKGKLTPSAKEKVGIAQALVSTSAIAAVGAGVAASHQGGQNPTSLPTFIPEPDESAISNQKMAFALKTGAAIAGVPVATYLAARTHYRVNIPRSAELAETQSQSIEVPDISDEQDNITFTVGGFYGGLGARANEKGQNYFTHKMKREVLDKNHFVVTHRNTEFAGIVENEALSKPPSLGRNKVIHRLKLAKQSVARYHHHYQNTIKSIIKNGRNPEAVKLAAEVIAYKKKYPSKQINLCGHSAGGMINHEAAEILKRKGIDVNVVNMGTAYYGFTKKVGKSHTIALRQDLYLKTTGTPRDPIYVGEEINKKADITKDKHHIGSYMRSPEVRAELRRLLNNKRTDSLKNLSRLRRRKNATRY